MSAASPASHFRPFGSRRTDATALGVTVRRETLGAAAGVFLLLSLWTAGTAWYLVNHDTLAAHLLAQQTEMQYAYEGRIGALKTRLDHVASEGMVAQESLVARVSELAARQALVESRQALVTRVVDQAGLAAPAGLSAAAEAFRTETARGAAALVPTVAKPTPVPNTLGLRLRDSSATHEPAAGDSERRPAHQSRLRVPDRLSQLQSAIALVETAQIRTIASLVHRSEQQITRLRGVMGETGVDPDRLDPASAKVGVGGPLVPITATAPSSGFDAVLEQARKTVATLDRLRRASAALPLGRPAAGDGDVTSGYGVRVDPFTRGPALHTGLDFRADYGAAVRATGGGQVIGAEFTGGYGNMVEIEHAGGVTTRYAHLSSLAVAPGQRVEAGTVIGRVGSTGRSTGPHLHYETRVDGHPVDPQRFLKAGARLAEVAPW